VIALFRKELREHAWVFSACAGFYAFSLFALGVNPAFNGEDDSALFGLRMFLLVVYPVLLIVLTSRLIAREYTGRTQLFLETLPVSRATILTAKLLFGLFLSLAAAGIAFYVFDRLADRHEVLDGRALGVVALRTFAYAVCAYGFFFAGGVLGRYRFAIFLILCVGFAIVSDSSTFKLDEFGPLRLVGPDFPYERAHVPPRAVAISLGLTLVFVALGYALALLREGTISALLAQRMSQREKVTIACVLMGMVFLKTFYDEARDPRPYDLSDARQAGSDHVAVKVGLGNGVTAERARQLAGRIVSGMDALSSELGFGRLPDVFVLPARDLGSDDYERGILKNASGTVVRANITDPHFDDDKFVSWIAREVVDTATKGRATEEGRRWLLDGFSTEWSIRQGTEVDYSRRCGSCHPGGAREKYLGEKWPMLITTLERQRGIPEHEWIVNEVKWQAYRAAYAFPNGVTREMVRNWLTTREQYGDCFTSALAWTGIQALRAKLDSAALRRFLHEAVARTPPTGLRSLSVRESPDSELLRTTGIRMDDIFAVWNAHLIENARGYAESVQKIPRLTASLDLAPVSSTGRELRYQVKLEPEPAQPLRITFVTSKLDPFDRPLDWKDLSIDERTYPDLRTGVLPRSFSRGDRLAWRAEARVEDLGCSVTTGVHRVEVP
jgi:hypothetical protein